MLDDIWVGREDMTCVSKSLCSDLALSWLSEFTGNSFSCASNLSKVGRCVAFGEGCSFFHLLCISGYLEITFGRFHIWIAHES